MNRRQFLSAGAAGLGLAAREFGQQAGQKPLRVGMIGVGTIAGFFVSSSDIRRSSKG